MNLGSSLRRRRRGAARSIRNPFASGRIDVEELRRLGEPFAFGIAVAVVGLLLGYVLATRAFFPAPAVAEDLVTVPDLRGLEVAEASGVLSEAGLELGTVDSIRHPDAEEGAVLGQTPLPGQLANPEGPVEITVSMGPERRAVPNVVRLQANRAATVLQATGFAIVMDSVEAELPKGRVVRVDPEPGTEANLPLEVTVFVSRGPPMVVMPDLVEMQEEEALARLDTLGLVAEVETVFRFGANQGAVIEQDPASGASLERGSAVRLVVGRRGALRRNIPEETPYDP